MTEQEAPKPELDKKEAVEDKAPVKRGRPKKKASKKAPVKKKVSAKKAKEETPSLKVENKLPQSALALATGRDDYGLLRHIDYKFKDDGFIDWKLTIPTEHLMVNEEKFAKYEKEIPKDLSKVKEKDLLIKLSGLKWASRVRGFKSASYVVERQDYESCTVRCNIVWNGNYETQGQETVFEDVASATKENCKGFSANFLESIASNRAFSRCVRNFLNINIVSDEEMGPEEVVAEEDIPKAQKTTPQDLFLDLATEKLGDFHKVMEFIASSGLRDPVDTSEVSDTKSLKKAMNTSQTKSLMVILNKPKK